MYVLLVRVALDIRPCRKCHRKIRQFGWFQKIVSEELFTKKWSRKILHLWGNFNRSEVYIGVIVGRLNDGFYCALVGGLAYW